MTESDRYLNALLEGNQRITSEIYTKFYRKVSTFITTNKGKEEDVEDVFHDALMYLIITHKKKALKINSFEGYFFTICKNIWKTSLKNKNKRVIDNSLLPLEDKDVDLSLFIIQQERQDLYRDAFHKLSANCKEILGNYFNGMNYEELLEEFSYASINTIRQRVFKCKAKVISLIKKDSRYNKLK